MSSRNEYTTPVNCGGSMHYKRRCRCCHRRHNHFTVTNYFLYAVYDNTNSGVHEWYVLVLGLKWKTNSSVQRSVILARPISAVSYITGLK